MQRIKVIAPSSTANLGPGFDVFGLAIDAFYDEIQICKTKYNGIKLHVNKINVNSNQNTASVAINNMRKKFDIKEGVEIFLNKGVPIGAGVGSSAASAAAAVVGFNKIFELDLDHLSLIKFAGIGEKASAGTIHYDNVAAAILGGFVIVRSNPLNVTKIKPPINLRICLAMPQIKTEKQKTKIARSVLPSRIKLADSTYNLSNATQMVCGFMNKDIKAIGDSMKDHIVEKAREKLIPGFYDVKYNAIKEGALGVAISGAGPTMIAIADKSSKLDAICRTMEKSFEKHNLKCNTVICKPSRGTIVK